MTILLVLHDDAIVTVQPKVLKCKAVKHTRDFPYPVGNETKVSLPLRKLVMLPLAFLYP